MAIDIRKRIASFGYAINGIIHATRTEVHMQIHLFFAVAALLACWFFEVAIWEWAIVSLCIGLVIGLELVNTALENLVDLVSPQQHPLAGRAKDTAAGAVLIAAIASVAVGLLIFGPRILAFLM